MNLNRLSSRSGSAIIIVVVLLGIASVVGMVFLCISAVKECEDLYKEVIKEVLAESPEDDKYGYGATPDSTLAKDEADKYKKKKLKPIVYIYPKLTAKALKEGDAQPGEENTGARP